MSRLSEHPKANLDLKQPLIHLYRNAPLHADPRRPVPVMCFMNQVASERIAKDDKKATCKICISLAWNRINSLGEQAAFSPIQKAREHFQEQISALLKLLPEEIEK